MSFDIHDQPRLMYSESLKDSLPEELFEEVFETSISVVIVAEKQEDSIMGSLVGVEFSESPKVDMKLSTENVFNFISNVLIKEESRNAKSVILALGNKAVNLFGPFSIKSAKIVEIDLANKTCVLAVDLIKLNV